MSGSNSPPTTSPQAREPLATMRLLGLDICKDHAATVVADMAFWILHASHDVNGKWFACINPHSYAELKKAPGAVGWFQVCSLDRSRWGWMSCLLRAMSVIPWRRESPEQTYSLGSMPNLKKAGRGRVFFLGSTESTLAKIEEKFRQDYCGVEIVGTYSPPYKPSFSTAENAEMVAAINAAKPDVLWVGMTAPKQEAWIAEHIDQLDIRFAGAIGAVFDFYVGQHKALGENLAGPQSRMAPAPDARARPPMEAHVRIGADIRGRRRT